MDVLERLSGGWSFFVPSYCIDGEDICYVVFLRAGGYLLYFFYMGLYGNHTALTSDSRAPPWVHPGRVGEGGRGGIRENPGKGKEGRGMVGLYDIMI